MKVHIYPAHHLAVEAIEAIDQAAIERLGATEDAVRHYGPRGRARLAAQGHAVIAPDGSVALTPAGIAAGLSMNGRHPVAVVPVPRRKWCEPIPLRAGGGFAVIAPPADFAGRVVDVGGSARTVPMVETAVDIAPTDIDRAAIAKG